MAGLPGEFRCEEGGLLRGADVAELAGGEEAPEVTAGVPGQLDGAAHVHDFGGAVVEVGLELVGEALQEVGGAIVAVAAEDRGVAAPGTDAFGDPHGEVWSGAIVTAAPPETDRSGSSGALWRST
jgi:hypothetical protein